MYSFISLLAAAGSFICDQRIKNSIEGKMKKGEKKELLGGKIILNKTHNSGVALNVLENKKPVVLAVSSILFGIALVLYCITLIGKGNGAMKLGFGLLAGGAASNIYDRWKRSYVVDYFSFGFLKRIVFNIADICIIVGCLVIMAVSIIQDK